MMNKLDGKILLDKSTVEYLLFIAGGHKETGLFTHPKSPTHNLQKAHEGILDEVKEALAQDLTGWAAVGDFEEVFSAMLNASPQLPGGGE
jgi:hypothetical protein